tara:strand:- start:95 stop:214 length:120 start_codon:yes stop_codon:yes gene_type:complete
VKLTLAGLSMLNWLVDGQGAYMLFLQLPGKPIFGYSNSQ